MNAWFWYAAAAAILYGLHQIFTKLAADGIGDGLGGLVVEGSAACVIAFYLVAIAAAGQWDQKVTRSGVLFSILTGICVGAGTIAFFRLFQRGGPLSAVPAILAGGAALMAVAGLIFFREPPTTRRIAGIVFSLLGLWLVRK